MELFREDGSKTDALLGAKRGRGRGADAGEDTIQAHHMLANLAGRSEPQLESVGHTTRSSGEREREREDAYKTGATPMGAAQARQTAQPVCL